MSLGSRRSLLAAAGAAAGDAWVPLNSSLLSSDATYVTLTSAAAEESWSKFQDLMLISYGRDKYTGTSTGSLLAQANSLGSTYKTAYLFGNGASVTSYAYSDSGFRTAVVPRDGTTSGTFGAAITYFNDINDTGKYTTALSIGACDMNNSNGQITKYTTIWENTVVVTSLRMRASSGASDIASGSRFDLFGLRAA